MAVCSICLRSNPSVNSAVNQELLCFYDDLLENEVLPNLTFCGNCKQLLKKCHDFKLLCQKSNKILQDWKKKKKTEKSTENLHTLIQPYYNEFFGKDVEKQYKTKTEKVNILLSNNENQTTNKNHGIENKHKKVQEIEVKLENIFRNNEESSQSNEILMETIEEIFPIEFKEETDFNTSENEHNGLGNDSDNESNGTDDKGDDEYKNDDDNDKDSEDDSENESDKSENETDNDSSDSQKSEIITKLLEHVKKKSVEMKKNKKQGTVDKIGEVKVKKRKGKKPLYDKEKLESIFDIVYFKTAKEARAELLERPNTEYYKNAAAKCDVCYSVFKCQKMVDYHMKWHDPSAGDHKCEICEMRFRTRKSLSRHKVTAHFGRYSCKKCPLITYLTSTMVMHSESHQGVQYECKFCDGVYNHRTTYLNHMRTSHRSQHACPLCARTFISPAGLRRHRELVHRTSTEVETESSVRCEECDLTFVNYDVYTMHVMKTPCHKDYANAMIACPLCGKRFDDRVSLGIHKRQEHPLQISMVRKKAKTEVTCKECGATGGHNFWLYQHYRTKHRDLQYTVQDGREKKHLCDQCGKSFQHKCLLVEHARVHTGERPHVCGVCGAAFNSKVKLYFHCERHKPPSKPCTVCGKKFSLSANLSNHMRTHIGDRRYKCSLCGKGFLHSTTLNEHIRGVHQHVRRERKPRQHGKLTE